jgi:hypothetical protein
MQQKTYIEDTIRSDKYDFAFNHYLSKERMQSLLADISGKTSLNKEDEQILSALTQATISAQLLLRLKNTGYNFS